MSPPLRTARPLWLLALLLILGLGCQPARKFPAVPHKSSVGEDGTRPRGPEPHYAWIDRTPPPDISIEFVDAASRPDEWKKLTGFWTHSWGGIGGQRTAHLGLSPLGAVAALRLSAAHEVIQVKVPLGLPNPTANIPLSNPPTYHKWLLGKRLFFDRDLLPGVPKHNTRGCTDCHDPTAGFTVHRPRPDSARKNPPTLLNCVYNKHQFWDGRATYLEEVIQRTLGDEMPPDGPPSADERAEVRHVWFGVVTRLGSDPSYLRNFQRVFGSDPTQDNVAKALATYLRTILSGNSVHDRAEAERARRGAAALEDADFERALDAASLKALAGDALTARQASRELARGHTLFHGKARCAVCHKGPLFTDHDFHNAGIGQGAGESDALDNSARGKEGGRFPHLPTGLKDRRYIGAFKTPTLRALPRTAPYMHDGSLPTLAHVLRYFNGGIRGELNLHLDPGLCDAPEAAQRLRLDAEELNALELFLKALDGGAVPRLVAEP